MTSEHTGGETATDEQVAAAVEAAFRTMSEVCISAPYMARIDDFRDRAGNVDREALRSADIEADQMNYDAVRAVVLAVLTAVQTGGDGHPR